MSKLYVIAIGGSGTRVLKSLVMLLASGMKAETEKIIPLIIDTDVNNGDLDYFRRIVRCYMEINKKLYSTVQREISQDGFFRTPIDLPKELNISGGNFANLSSMINYLSMNAQGQQGTKGLVDLLFSQKNREMNLEKGFLGIPSVGSIVLRDVVESRGFKEFTQNFKTGDRIFIISSIFGGTGAAGFPLLLNIFRDPQSKLNNAQFINDAIIGGISLQPYFEVDAEKFNNGESPIDSNTFISKTKAALSYYEKYLAQNLNAMFFIGDTRKSNFPNNPGGKEQRNPANFIEFVSALSILKFLNYEKHAQTRKDLPTDLKFFEFGIETDEANLNLTHLGKTRNELIKQMIKFKYFSVYVTNFLDDAMADKHMAWKKRLKVPENFATSEIIKLLKEFCSSYYYQWLFQLKNDYHGRKFIPFNLQIENEEQVRMDENQSVKLNVNDKALFQLVNGISAKNNSNFLTKDKIDLDETFNVIVSNINNQESLQNFEIKFISLFNEGIEELYNTRFLN